MHLLHTRRSSPVPWGSILTASLEGQRHGPWAEAGNTRGCTVLCAVRVQSQRHPRRTSDLCTVRCHPHLTSSMILLGGGVNFILHLVTISRGCRGSFQRLQTEPGFASTLPSPSARPACRGSPAGSGPRRKVFLQGVWEGKMLVPVSHHHGCPNLCPGGCETLLQQGLRDPQDHTLAQLRLGSGAKSRRRGLRKAGNRRMHLFLLRVVTLGTFLSRSGPQSSCL